MEEFIDNEEPLSSLSDSSFVILGQGSIPSTHDISYQESVLTSITNGKASFPDCEAANTSVKSSNGLSGSMFSEDGIQKKLNELVKENYQLKETLNQNNLAIKSQLDTFFMWQQEVLKTHKTHKQKFLETKELILKLRAENSSLKQQLEDSLVSSPSANDMDIYAEVKKKPEELDKLKEKVKEYEKMYSSLTSENENLSMKVLKLTEELKEAKSEVLKLNNEVQDLGRDNTFLKQRNDNRNSLESTSHRSLPNSEARSQISNLLKQLDEEKLKVLKLKEELKETEKTNDKGSELSTTDELNQYIDNLNDMNVSLNMQKQRFSSLHSWVSLAEESLKENKINAGVECNLLCELNELKSHLNQEENVSREKQEALKELKKKFTALLDDYKALQLKLSTINNNNSNIDTYKEEISSLLAKLKAKDNELMLKEEECSNLKETIGELNLVCERVDVLNHQVDIYKCDFQEERAARENLVSERELMAEQIRYLQNEVKNLQGTPQKNDTKTSPSESTGGGSGLKCTSCGSPFSDHSEYAEHNFDCSCIHNF